MQSLLRRVSRRPRQSWAASYATLGIDLHALQPASQRGKKLQGRAAGAEAGGQGQAQGRGRHAKRRRMFDFDSDEVTPRCFRIPTSSLPARCLVGVASIGLARLL